MSLLEDVFLENEAGEAQELERIIEGDEFEDRPRSRSSDSDNASEKEDEAEEDKRRVDPTKAKPTRIVKNPRVVLNPARLTGPRGIHVIPDHFKDFKFKGKGHEKEDLDLVLKKLEHWAYRLYPKFQFADCLKKIETLGKKGPVKVNLHKIRTDQFTTDETVVQKDSSDDETPEPVVDEFDILLQQQIELARATPAPSSAKKGFQTPGTDRSLMMPKATSSPSINDEQRERMLTNRRLAEERRLARLKHNSIDNNTNTSGNNDNTRDNNENTSDSTENRDDKKQNTHDNVTTNDNFDNDDNITAKKHNKSNIIDSSDEENDDSVVNQSVTVDIHDNSRDMSRYNDNDKNITDKHMAGDNQMDIIEETHYHNDISDKQVSGDNQTDKIEDAHKHNDIDNKITDELIAEDVQTVIIEEAHKHKDVDIPNLSDKQTEEQDLDIHNGNNEIINDKDKSNSKISENIDGKESEESQNAEITETEKLSATESQHYNDNENINTKNVKKNVGVDEEIMDVDFSDDF